MDMTTTNMLDTIAPHHFLYKFQKAIFRRLKPMVQFAILTYNHGASQIIL